MAQPEHQGKPVDTTAKPRVLYAGRMAVFAGDGVRAELDPAKHYPDGFTAPNESIMMVGPEELRPENHKILRQQLFEKVKEARLQPYSKMDTYYMREAHANRVCREAIMQFPAAMVKHYAHEAPKVKEQWLNDAMFQRIREDTHNPYDLVSLVRLHYDRDDKKLYKDLKQLFKRYGQDDAFHKVEVEVATKERAEMLQTVKCDPAERDKVVAEMVKVDGRSITIEPAPLRALREKIIRATYQDLDARIEEARALLVSQSQKKGIEKPFEYTADERKHMALIDDIALGDSIVKPMVLAGYCNPKLTVIVETGSHNGFHGVSYEGQDMIRVCRTSTRSSFKEILQEELLHQGMDKVYNNLSLPYRSDSDSRKALMEQALARDVAVEPETMGRLGFSINTSYNKHNITSVHKEIPVKMLRYMDDGLIAMMRANCDNPEIYQNLEALATKVHIPDAQAYLQGKPLPLVAPDLTRREYGQWPPKGTSWKIE